MDSTKLNDWIQIVGIFGVMASLVFVGLQLKQSHQIALADIYQARTTALVDFTNTMGSNELALTAFAKLANGEIDQVNEVENLASDWMATSVLVMWENSHYQYRLGFLPEEHWARIKGDIEMQLSNPLWGPYFRSRKSFMTEAFRHEFEKIESDVDTEQ